MPTIHWTLLFTGACALLQCVLTALVIARRLSARIDLLDGGDMPLVRRIRAHGNFSETAPMALLVLLALELAGAPGWWLVLLGSTLLTGRVLHAAAMLGVARRSARFAGMKLTLAVLSLGAISCLGIWAR